MPGQMKLGIIGLGKMGESLAPQVIEKNIMVVGKSTGKSLSWKKRVSKCFYFLFGRSSRDLSFFASWPHCRQYTRRAFAISATRRCSNGWWELFLFGFY